MSFCSNDESAYGLIAGLKEHGLQVPRDIAIAGFDDLSFSAVMDPTLTTVRLPRQEMAEQAVGRLKALIEDGAENDSQAEESRHLVSRLVPAEQLHSRSSRSRQNCDAADALPTNLSDANNYNMLPIEFSLWKDCARKLDPTSERQLPWLPSTFADPKRLFGSLSEHYCI